MLLRSVTFPPCPQRDTPPLPPLQERCLRLLLRRQAGVERMQREEKRAAACGEVAIYLYTSAYVSIREHT